MKKKLLALLLTLAFLLPLLPAGAVAHAEEIKPEIYGTSLFLENNIAINFVVDAYAFGQNGLSLPRMTFSFCGETTEVSAYTEKNGYYYFTFRGLTAVQMGETVTATLSGVKDGSRVYGDPITRSVRAYCEDALSLYAGDTALCTLIADLLTYGAKSQLYFGYDTAHLVTDGLTLSGTNSDPQPASVKDLAYATVDDPAVIWYGSNLKLMDSVDLQFFFTASDTDCIRVDVKDDGGTVLASFYEEDLTPVGGYYRFRLNTLTPDQFGETLYVTAYRDLGDMALPEGELPLAGLGENAVSDTICYSIESYAAEAIPWKNDPALTALLNAMLNYGASAAAYVAAATPAVTSFTRATLDALPVASAGMTNAQLRQLVLDFFTTQSSIPWVVQTEIPYTYDGNEDIDAPEDANYTLVADTVYCGMPYSNAGSSIYQFLDYYNEETGVLTQPYGSKIGKYLGNNCCSAVYWAWSRISSTITFQSTDYMTYPNGVLPVGDYEIDQSVAHFTADYDTKTVCENNGESVMYKAYAALNPGDALVSFDKDGDTLITHHTMMAVSVTKQTNLFSSTINGEYSKVTVHDQSNSTQKATVDGKDATRFGRLDREVTFSSLYSHGYIPITCAELAGIKPVQAASAALNSAVTGTVTLAKLGAKSVKTNYPMAKVTLTAEDARGRTVAQVYSHTRYRIKSLGLSTLAGALDDQLPAGAYRITVEVLLSNGQTKTVFGRTITKG